MENMIYKYRVERNGKVVNTETNRSLKMENVRGGYERVTLSNNGKTQRHFVHRLVATVYLPNPEHDGVDCKTCENCWEKEK